MCFVHYDLGVKPDDYQDAGFHFRRISELSDDPPKSRDGEERGVLSLYHTEGFGLCGSDVIPRLSISTAFSTVVLRLTASRTLFIVPTSFELECRLYAVHKSLQVFTSSGFHTVSE